MAEPDEARVWLAQKHAVPALEDRSLDGRRAFLATYGDVLWAFWRETFSLAYADGTLRPAVALGSAQDDAGALVADRLIEALRTRPVLETAPAWTQIEQWHAWLVGRQAVVARRAAESRRARPGSEDATRSGQDLGASDVLADLEMLLHRWADVLRAVVAGTGVAAIESDWLWATRHARKPLAEAFASHPTYGRLAEADLDGCVRRSSAPGSSGPERSRRSRAGACAAFRFNVEEVARRAADVPALVAARRVLIGPAEPEGPYHRPKLPIDGGVLAGFREALRRCARLSTRASDDGYVARLWRGVIACGLNKSVLRILPAHSASLLASDMDVLVAAGAVEPEEPS